MVDTRVSVQNSSKDLYRTDTGRKDQLVATESEGVGTDLAWNESCIQILYKSIIVINEKKNEFERNL